MVGNNSPARTTRTPTLLNSAGMILPGRLRPGRDHAGPKLGNGGHLLGHEFAGCPLQRREAPRFAEIRTPSCLPTDHLARRALSHQLSHRQISAEVVAGRGQSFQRGDNIAVRNRASDAHLRWCR